MDPSLAPAYVRVTYDGQLFPHHMVIPVNVTLPLTPAVEPDVILKDASTVGVESAISDMFDIIKGVFPASIHFGLAEIHTVDEDTGEDTFIYAWNVNKVGSAGAAAVPTAQFVMSCKTTAGSAYKLYLMESVILPNIRDLPPYTETFRSDMSDFITGDSSPVYGRKNAYPFVPVSAISKTNDRLRKQQGLA